MNEIFQVIGEITVASIFAFFMGWVMEKIPAHILIEKE